MKKKNKEYLLTLIFSLLMLASFDIFTQNVAITDDENYSPEPSAMLDIKSLTKGLLIPRVTSTDDVTSPATGLLVYQTGGSAGFYSYNGSSWVMFGSGASNINDLSDGKTGGNSLFLGANSGGNDDASDNRNAACGVEALYSNVSGYQNTAMGYQSLYSNTDGIVNTAIGYKSMYLGNSGQGNTAIGSNSLENNTGHLNFAGGYKAMSYNTSGDNNICIGGFANRYNQEGSNNVIIGYESGHGLTTHNKSGCVFLGYQAGYSEDNSNKLYIENSNSATPLIYGEFDNDMVKINGDLNVMGVLNINDVYQLPEADGVSGQALQTDGNGSLGWENFAKAINDLTDGKTYSTSLYLGTDAGSNNNTGYNVGIGYYALKNSTEQSNVAVGAYANSRLTSGVYNVSIGRDANLYLKEGSYNTIIGANAGYGGIDKIYSGNVFLGYAAGYFESNSNKLYIENSSSESPLIYGEFDNDLLRINGDLDIMGGLNINNEYLFPDVDGAEGQTIRTDGSGNVSWVTDSLNLLKDAKTGGESIFLGMDAGLNEDGNNRENTAVGTNALKGVSEGQYNTAVGYSALIYDTVGNYNTGIGHSALMTCRGSNNTAVGVDASRLNKLGEDNTSVGYSALRRNEGDKNVAIGSYAVYNSIANENVGVGYYALQANGLGASNTAIGTRALSNVNGGHYNTALGCDAGPTWFGYDNTTAIGYGAVPSSSNYVRIGNNAVLSIGGSVDWTNYSDKRFKRNIKENVSGLDFILKLRPVTFQWDIRKLNEFTSADSKLYDNEVMQHAINTKESIVYTGFLAQEVEEAALASGFNFSGVKIPENEHTPYSLSYAEFVVPLVKAVQEQQDIINEMNERIKILEAIIKELK